MRHLSSCTPCRIRKKRCTLTASGDQCTFCCSRKLVCDFTETIAKRPTTQRKHVRNVRSASTPSLSEGLPSAVHFALAQPSYKFDILEHPVCDVLIDLYFDIFHNKQQILFHRQSLINQRRAGLLPDFITLGLIALTARFSTHEYFHGVTRLTRAQPYLSAALRSFHARDELVSIHALQACILLSYVCFTEGQIDQESLLGAQAVRMAQILKLPDRHSNDIIANETQIRLFWQVTMMDTWNSVRDQLPRLMLPKTTTPRPMNERDFEDLLIDETVINEFCPLISRNSSMWAQIVELTETFAQVTEILITSVNHPVLSLQTESKTRAVSMQLDQWLQQLPASLQDTPANFQSAINLGWSREFAVIHLIYHHQCQLLYFPYLSRQISSPADRRISEYIQRCRVHAEALSELMWKTNTTAGMECLWSPVNGHLLVVASTVLLHTLVFDPDPLHITLIKKLLEQNFVMLLQFQEYWPTLQNALARLQMFQQSCRHRNEQRNFQMDAWMLEFLLNYSSVLDKDRQLGELSASPQSLSADGGTTWTQLIDENIVRSSSLNEYLSFV